MPQYEMVYILRPDLEPEAVKGVVDRFGQRVTEQGGSVDFVEVWGKRRMAFTLRKFREGIYVLTRFTVDSARLPELKRLTRIMDDVMRALIVVAEGPLPAAKHAPERPAEPAREAPEAQAVERPTSEDEVAAVPEAVESE
ncbi:MAG TPA: 30S ribosomal protein S6 [bacterium]|nr:30S ribosomal protein S6 [bacterium]